VETVDNFTQTVKSNNNIIIAQFLGQLQVLFCRKQQQFYLKWLMGKLLLKSVPAGPGSTNEGQTVQADQLLTNNPNVGGLVKLKLKLYSNPARVQGLIVFLGTIFLTQIFLVLKENKLESSII
jgi:apocytochrome f